MLIDWADSLIDELKIPAKITDILKPDQQEHIKNDDHMLNLAQKAERNPTGFTNAIRYDTDDYLGILQKAT